MQVAISGGGIAGLSAAIVLRRCGHEVTIYERDTRPSDIGAGVICYPNATLVLRHLGLEQAVARVAGRPLTMQRRSHQGEPLGELSLEAINQLIGAPSYSVLRVDLHRILMECAVRAGARIEYGRRVVAVSAAGELVFEDGTERMADWVLGADGRMSSPTRRFVLGDAAPRYGGFVNWIGIARTDAEVFEPHAVVDVWGMGERFGIVPISARVAYFAGAASSPLLPRGCGPFLPALRQRFAGWPEPVEQVLRFADEASINEIYLHDHDPCARWHKGNVLLLGDAAHAPLPTSGQGACQALEDAYHLDQLLQDGTPLDPAVFFTRWTDVRRDKANAIIQSGRGFAASLFDEDPGRAAERNRRSRHADFAQAARGMADLWGRGLKSAERAKL